MTPEDKKRWTDALRSGKYQQGCGRLRTPDNKFCCLGVACDVFEPEGWWQEVLPDGEPVWFNGSQEEALPESLQERLGLDEIGTLPDGRALTKLNDRYRLSFEEIANIIEEQL